MTTQQRAADVLLKAKVKANALNSGLFADMKKAPHRASRLVRGLFVFCAPVGIRTPNLLIRSQMLYPLSYRRSVTEATCRRLAEDGP